jgi:hypothetical protein
MVGDMTELGCAVQALLILPHTPSSFMPFPHTGPSYLATMMPLHMVAAMTTTLRAISHQVLVTIPPP